MKFMVSWSIQQDKWLPIQKKWSSLSAKDRATVGKGVTMIGRWHDPVARRVADRSLR